MKNVDDILAAYSNQDIMSRFGITGNGQRFYKTAFACDQFEYCIFASDDVIGNIRDRIPSDRRNYLMDATFKICPYGTFNQLLIIYVSYLDSVKSYFFVFCLNRQLNFFFLQHIVPFIYVLMSCKKQVCYEHLLAYIHDNIFDLDGASFTTDYELAMRNAIAKQYPNAVYRCCWFHFTQAVKRNASKIAGFVSMIRGNVLERELYYKKMCLPLLPACTIRAAFAELKEKGLRIVNNVPFHRFLEYVERQWIEKVSASISFSVFFFFCNFMLYYFVGRAGKHHCVRHAHTDD